MGRLAEINQATLLVLKTYDGNTSRGVQARVYNDAGTEQSGSPFTLSHSARGNYKSTSWVPTVIGNYYVNYEVYTDGTFATLDTNYTQITEVVNVKSPLLRALRDGTAQAGTSTTITLDASASATDDAYKTGIIQIISGTGANQSRTITGYVGSTKVATVDFAWTTTPDSTSVFTIIASGSALLTALETSSIHNGTAQAGGSNTITLASTASSTDNLYRGETIKIYSGTGAGQTRVITGYVGSTKVATVGRNWATNPDSTSLYSVMPTANPKVNDSLEVTVGTNNDKTGYSLTQAFPTNFSSLSIDGSGRIDLGKWIGVAPNALISGRVDANAQVVGDKTGYSLTQTFPTNFSSLVIDVSGRIDLGKWVGVAPNALISGRVDSNAQVVADKTGYSLTTLESMYHHSGTAQNGTDNTITLAAGASASDDYYKGSMIKVYGGTGAAQTRIITAYNGTTKIATVSRNWVTNPDNTSTYAVLVIVGPKLSDSLEVTVGTNNDKTGYTLTQAFPTNFSSLSIDGSGRIDLGKWVGVAPNALISGRVDANAQVVADKTGYSITQTFPTNFDLLSIDGSGRIDLGKWLGSTPNALISGRIDANAQVVGDKTGYSLANGSIVAATFATDAIDSNALATSAASEIAAKILANPANLLVTDSSGFVTLANGSITAAKFAADAIDSNALATSAVSEIVSAIFGNTIDTKTFAQINEIILAYATGKIEKSGNDYVYKKQDDTTTLFTLTASPTDRIRS